MGDPVPDGHWSGIMRDAGRREWIPGGLRQNIPGFVTKPGDRCSAKKNTGFMWGLRNLEQAYRSTDFLLYVAEDVGVEKSRQVNLQTVTDFLNCGNGGRVISAAHDIVQSGLGDSAQGPQTMDGQVLRVTKLTDAKLQGIFRPHKITFLIWSDAAAAQ